MTTPKAPGSSRERDEVLEKNVESLLGSSYDPPRIARDARVRIREQLIAGASAARPAAARRRRSPRSALMLAGVGLVAASAAAAVVAQLVDREHPAAGQIAARDGRRLELTDGTRVVVADGATVDVLGPRHVRVRGRVYLDVAPGAGRFVVDTAHGPLEVLGTRFVVDAQDAATTTAVVRGVVQQAGGGDGAVLHAGQQGTMIAGKPPTRGPAPRLSSLVGWAQTARVQAEGPGPRRRSGTLYARNPNVQSQDFPLPMRELGVDVFVENQVARVALDQTFHNPRGETLEGVYRFTTPTDAALARLAMYVDGKRMEAAVVERMAARRIYEEIVYRRLDPALAEWTGAGRVDLRIFPLPPQQDKRVILAYTQPLPRLYDDWTLSVPLPDLDAPVDAVKFNVRIADCGACEIHSPSHAVEVARDGAAAIVTYAASGADVGDSLVLTVRDEDRADRVAQVVDGAHQYLLVRARPDLAADAGGDAAPYAPRKWIILDDVSASRGALERRAQADLVDRLIDAIDEDDEVAVATFDVAVRRHGDFTRAADVDRRALRQALLAEPGGVGATDLGEALDAAVERLAGTAPGQAYVVYLGDGVVTGGARDLAALKQRLAGKATFVGFAVGDGADVPALGALADATDGLVVPVDPADDLGWRALDAIATLYTPRVVGLTARALDVTGQPVDGAIAYLRGRQVGDGDEVEVAVRAPVGAAIAKVQLDGARGGRPWSRTVDLAGAERPAGAGYLPRLWAHRHITALMVQRNTAPAPQPCGPDTPGARCPTYEDQRIAHREALRQEIVALGKQYFLLSPHTSLIVLENDAMYAHYKVERDAAPGWAHYVTPDTIPTGPVAPPLSLGAATDVGIVRSPTDPFYRYDAWGWDGRGLGDVEQRSWFASDGAVPAEALRGSVADPQGGVRAGADTGAASTVDSTEPALDVGATITTAPVVGTTGTGAGGGGMGQGSSAGRSASREDARNERLGFDLSGDRDLGGNAGPAQPVAAAEVTETITVDELADKNATWSVGGGVLGKTKDSRRARRQRGERWNQHGRWGGGAPYPAAYHYAMDPRLDDLTERVPAMLGDALDGAIRELRAAAGGATGRVDDDARRMLAAARALVRPGVYRWGAGPEITVDAAGRMAWRVTHEEGLVEVVTYDGATLHRAYPELGLVFARPIGEASPALALTALPVLGFDADHLARWYVVTRKDDRTLALAPAAAPDAPTLELVLDDAGRFAALRGADGRALIELRYQGDAPIGATVLGDDVAVAYAPAAVTDAVAALGGDARAAADAVEIALPIRPAAHGRTAVAAVTQGAGSAAWRDAQRQLLAGLVTQRDFNGALVVVRELAAHGGLALGDVVLASGALRLAADREAIDLIAAAGEPAVAVGKYLAASRSYGKKPRVGVFAAAASGDGLVAALARHRETLAAVEADKLDAALAALRAGKAATTLRVIAAARIAQQWSWRSARAAEAWDAVADGAWRNVARYEAARTLYNKGDHAAAADRFAELLAGYDLDAAPAALDWTAKQAMLSSRRGQVGWQLAWSAYRNRLLGADDLGQVMALLTASTQLGEGDLDRVVGRAADLAGDDLAAQAEIIEHALTYGQLDRAVPLLDAALARGATPDLHRLASHVAERQGRVADAAAHLEQALDAEAAAGDGVPLAQLRADMQRLLAMRGRLAVLVTGAARDARVAEALAVADRWRALDPDNAALDRQIGEVLLAAGHREEAWRQLSTAIERHPADGDGWALVAEVMEKEGRLDEALGYWQQAVVIDQTNPTWRLRKAQTLYALGRDAEALALLEDIAARKWHERWWNVTYQVTQLLQQAKAAAPRPTR